VCVAFLFVYRVKFDSFEPRQQAEREKDSERGEREDRGKADVFY
jgi:hypothetical protein